MLMPGFAWDRAVIDRIAVKLVRFQQNREDATTKVIPISQNQRISSCKPQLSCSAAIVVLAGGLTHAPFGAHCVHSRTTAYSSYRQAC